MSKWAQLAALLIGASVLSGIGVLYLIVHVVRRKWRNA